MSTDLIWQTVSNSSADTEQIGRELGMRCKGGEVLELVSDLGGGKTTFVRGLAAGLGSTDAVASPSFTLSREYKADDKTLYHFDFYRLQDAGLVGNELAEVVDDPQAVVAVEWADIVEDILPAQHLTIHITNVGDTKRQFKFSCPESLAYLRGEDT